MSWSAKISCDRNDEPRYSMRIAVHDNTPAIVLWAKEIKPRQDFIVLWSGKTFDQAMELLTEFQTLNSLDDTAASAVIDITELM